MKEYLDSTSELCHASTALEVASAICGDDQSCNINAFMRTWGGSRNGPNLLGNPGPSLWIYPLSPSLSGKIPSCFLERGVFWAFVALRLFRYVDAVSEVSCVQFSNHLEPKRFSFSIHLSAGWLCVTELNTEPGATWFMWHLLKAAAPCLLLSQQNNNSNEQQYAQFEKHMNSLLTTSVTNYQCPDSARTDCILPGYNFF